MPFFVWILASLVALCRVASLTWAATAAGQVLTEAPRFETASLLEPSGSEAEASALADRDAPAVIEPDDSATEPAATDGLAEALRPHHPWAHFMPGAWRRVRIVSEGFDAEGMVSDRSVGELVETLVAVDDQTYTIQVEQVASLAGRQTPGSREVRRLWLLTDRPVETGAPEVVPADPSSISLGGVAYPCSTWSVTSKTPRGTEVETLHVSAATTPAVLRRDATTASGDDATRRQTTSVTRFGLPVIYAGELTPAWHLATDIERPSGGRTERVSIINLECPGGSTWDATCEYDASGRRGRWSVAELVASGRTPAEQIEPTDPAEPGVTIEIRPRRFLRLLRREERQAEELQAETDP